MTREEDVSVPVAKQVFADLASAVSQALEEGGAYGHLTPQERCCSSKDKRRAESTSCAAAGVKLSVSGSEGKVLILRIAQPGEILGVSAAVSARGYEATAETEEPWTKASSARPIFSVLCVFTANCHCG